MKALLVLAVMSASGANLDALERSYYDQRAICRVGDDANQSKNACEMIEKIGKELIDAGLCWNASELVWKGCE